jgi:PAS domain S-box-containing protein
MRPRDESSGQRGTVDEIASPAGPGPPTSTDRLLMSIPVFGDTPVGIALIGVTGDDCGRIVRANRVLADLLASTVEDLTGSVVCEFIHEEDRTRAVEEFTLMLGRARGSCEGEGRLLVGEGGVRWVRVHAGVMPTAADARPMVMLHINQIAELTGHVDVDELAR